MVLTAFNIVYQIRHSKEDWKYSGLHQIRVLPNSSSNIMASLEYTHDLTFMEGGTRGISHPRT